MNKSRGFTMIELLVVITIIIVITGIGAVSYSAAQRKGRDSKRMSDLEQIRAALEMYRSDSDLYPNDLDTLETNDYLNIPESPQGNGYEYTPGSSNLTYTLCAYLELEAGDDCNYEVTNP